MNWRFLPEEVFLDRKFHILLLLLHIAVIAVFFCLKWARFVFLAEMCTLTHELIICLTLLFIFYLDGFRANGGLKALLTTTSTSAPETRIDPSGM